MCTYLFSYFSSVSLLLNHFSKIVFRNKLKKHKIEPLSTWCANIKWMYLTSEFVRVPEGRHHCVNTPEQIPLLLTSTALNSSGKVQLFCERKTDTVNYLD